MAVALEARRAAHGRPERTLVAEQTFNQFFLQAYEQTLGLVTLAVGNRVSAEDAAQEAFARAFNRWSTVANMEHPARWVARVAINLAIDQLRKTSREVALEPALEAPLADHVEELWVRWNLDRLTPMQRAAMVRRYIDGMAVDEVATALGRSPQTVKSHIRLGRRRLRQYLGEDCP